MGRLAASLALALAVFAGATVPAARAEPIEIPQVQPCGGFYPSAVAAPSTEPVALRVAVVLHNVEIADARKIVARAERAYAPLGIDVQPTFLLAYLPDQSHEDLFPKLKALFGGRRPDWAHAVVLMTAGDISNASSTLAAGYADCVGGVEYPDRAFALAEARGTGDESAEIFGHELGHLLGADHPHGNCAEGTRQNTLGDACTLMFNDVGFTSLAFGTVASSIVRGHAEAFATPLAARPPADGTVLSVSPYAGLDPCTVPAYDDPAGDQAPQAGLTAGEGDVTGGRFFVRDGRPWLRITVAEIDGEIDQADQVSWRLEVSAGGARYRLWTTWDGAGAPAAVLTDVASGKTAPVPGVVLRRGAPGVVEIPWPLAREALLTPGVLQGVVGPLRGAGVLYNFDPASPRIGGVRLSDCGRVGGATPDGAGRLGADRAPGAATGGDAVLTRLTDASRAAAARAVRALRFTLIRASARRASKTRRLAFRVRGTAQNVLLRLVDRRGRTVGRGSLGRVTGSTTAYVQLLRRVGAGRYVLVASVRGGAARRIPVRLR